MKGNISFCRQTWEQQQRSVTVRIELKWLWLVFKKWFMHICFVLFYFHFLGGGGCVLAVLKNRMCFWSTDGLCYAKTLRYNNYWELLGCFKDRHPTAALTWLYIGSTRWTGAPFVFLRTFWWSQSCLCLRNMYCVSLKQRFCSFGHYTTYKHDSKIFKLLPSDGDRQICDISFRKN